jgi:hypothetical protein
MLPRGSMMTNRVTNTSPKVVGSKTLPHPVTTSSPVARSTTAA